MGEQLNSIEVNEATLRQLRLGLKADDGSYLTQPGMPHSLLGATPLVVNDLLPDGVARFVPAVEAPMKVVGSPMRVTQELLDDQPPGNWIGNAIRRAMTGTTVAGRWLRNAVAGHQLARLPFHRRGVMGYPPLTPDPDRTSLQDRWGRRTTIARYLKHHDN